MPKLRSRLEWRWRPGPRLATCGSKTRPPTNCSWGVRLFNRRCLRRTPSATPAGGDGNGGGATDALALPPLCFRVTSRFKEPYSTMRAQITPKAATSSTGTVLSRSKGPASTSRCDHCREELRLVAHRYWHMQFCSAACMTAYQQRLAPDTKVKICGLDFLPSEDWPSGSNLLPPLTSRPARRGFLILSQCCERPER
jgi:hypothetical protein